MKGAFIPLLCHRLYPESCSYLVHTPHSTFCLWPMSSFILPNTLPFPLAPHLSLLPWSWPLFPFLSITEFSFWLYPRWTDSSFLDSTAGSQLLSNFHLFLCRFGAFRCLEWTEEKSWGLLSGSASPVTEFSLRLLNSVCYKPTTNSAHP